MIIIYRDVERIQKCMKEYQIKSNLLQYILTSTQTQGERFWNLEFDVFFFLEMANKGEDWKLARDGSSPRQRLEAISDNDWRCVVNFNLPIMG
jgi:hypothetical protein